MVRPFISQKIEKEIVDYFLLEQWDKVLSFANPQ